LNYSLGRQEQDPELQMFESTRLTLNAPRHRSCRVMVDGEILRLNFPIELRMVREHLKVLTDPEHGATAVP
ncbi:MAG: hypothetical protein ABL994_25790, partial [Verrucomicrobiales bacterium]